MPEDNRQGAIPTAFRAIDTAIASLVQATVAAPSTLAAEVDRFRTVREKTLRVLDEVTARQAVWSPRAGAWSIVQISDHLLRSDELFRRYFHRVIEEARKAKGAIRIDLHEFDGSVAGVPGQVMRVLEVPVRVFGFLVPRVVRETMVRRVLVPAISPAATEPRPGVTLEQMRGGLASSLVETERLLRAPMPVGVEESTLDHPLMGNNTLREWVRITVAHEKRHHGQIAALREHGDFPG